MEIIDSAKSLVQKYLDEFGIELVDITYRREQGGMTLRLLVDTPDGVTLAECEGVNNYLSEQLDKENIIEEHYVLEVSSPGLDRALTTDRDFQRVMGKDLNITTYQAVDMRKYHDGKLMGMDEENVVIEADGVSTVIPRKLIAKARLRIEI